MSSYMRFDPDISNDAFWMAVSGHRRCEMLAEHCRIESPVVAKRLERIAKIFAMIAKECAERDKLEAVSVVHYADRSKDEGCEGV